MTLWPTPQPPRVVQPKALRHEPGAARLEGGHAGLESLSVVGTQTRQGNHKSVAPYPTKRPRLLEISDGISASMDAFWKRHARL